MRRAGVFRPTTILRLSIYIGLPTSPTASVTACYRLSAGAFLPITGRFELQFVSCVRSEFWKLFGPSGRQARRIGSRHGPPQLSLLTTRGWMTFAIEASKLVAKYATVIENTPAKVRRQMYAGHQIVRRQQVRRSSNSTPVCLLRYVERFSNIVCLQKYAGKCTPVIE